MALWAQKILLLEPWQPWDLEDKATALLLLLTSAVTGELDRSREGGAYGCPSFRERALARELAARSWRLPKQRIQQDPETCRAGGVEPEKRLGVILLCPSTGGSGLQVTSTSAVHVESGTRTS